MQISFAFNWISSKYVAKKCVIMSRVYWFLFILNIVLEYSQNDRFVLLISAVLYLLLSDINGLYVFFIYLLKKKKLFGYFLFFSSLLKLSKKVRTTNLVKIIFYICFYTRNFVAVYSWTQRIYMDVERTLLGRNMHCPHLKSLFGTKHRSIRTFRTRRVRFVSM